MSRRFLVATMTVAVSTLSACIVVPLDPQTGQPYSQRPQTSTITVLQPPPAASQPAVLTARLYPLNVQANKAGLLTALVMDPHSGRGSFSINYLGDTLQGEATRVDNSYAAFGLLHNEVLGSNPAGQRAFSGRRGIANGFGAKGVNVQCEYLITGPGIGTGVCLLSDGAKYQMHFGN